MDRLEIASKGQQMKNLASSIFVSLLLIIAAPAYADSNSRVFQVYYCEYTEDTTADDDDADDAVLALAHAWLEAAKKTPGGANMSLAIRFPIAEGDGVDGDFVWVISTPSFAEWGQFTDAYDGSAVADVDDELFANLADCGQSTLWEGIIAE